MMSEREMRGREMSKGEEVRDRIEVDGQGRMTRWCGDCHEWQPVEDFDRRYKGKQSICKEAAKRRRREQRAERDERLARQGQGVLDDPVQLHLNIERGLRDAISATAKVQGVTMGVLCARLLGEGLVREQLGMMRKRQADEMEFGVNE